MNNRVRRGFWPLFVAQWGGAGTAEPACGWLIFGKIDFGGNNFYLPARVILLTMLKIGDLFKFIVQFRTESFENREVLLIHRVILRLWFISR